MQKEKFGHKIDQVYSLIVDMCEPNVTAMNIVQTHFQNDSQHLWPNTLWRMLVARFTYANKHRASEAVLAVTEFAKKHDETHKAMVDRFNKCISDIRNIDATQVPQESLLIDILKKSMKKERALMIFLSRQHDLTLKSLMEQIEGLDAFNEEHKPKPTAVANFLNKGSRFKKAHAKKQKSGRGSGFDHVKLRCLL